jgi:hypothetical protein
MKKLLIFIFLLTGCLQTKGAVYSSYPLTNSLQLTDSILLLANGQLYRATISTIRGTPVSGGGDTVWTNDNGNIYLIGGTNNIVLIESQLADNATNNVLVIDTAVPWITANNWPIDPEQKLVSIRQNGTEYAYFNRVGGIVIGRDTYVGLGGDDGEALLAGHNFASGEASYISLAVESVSDYVTQTNTANFSFFGDADPTITPSASLRLVLASGETNNVTIGSTLSDTFEVSLSAVRADSKLHWQGSLTDLEPLLIQPNIAPGSGLAANKFGSSSVLTNGDRTLSIQNAGTEYIYAGPGGSPAFSVTSLASDNPTNVALVVDTSVPWDSGGKQLAIRSGGVEGMSIAINNYYGNTGSIVHIGNYPAGENPPDTAQLTANTNSMIFNIGDSNGDYASLTNCLEIFNIGDANGQVIITDGFDIYNFGFGNGQYYSTNAEYIFNIGTGNGTSGTIFDGVSWAFNYGVLCGIFGTYTNVDHIFNYGTAAGANQALTNSSHIYAFGNNAGRYLSGSWTDLMLFGDHALPTQNHQTVFNVGAVGSGQIFQFQNGNTNQFTVDWEGSITAGSTNRLKTGPVITGVTVALTTTNYLELTINGVVKKVALVQ